MRVNGAQVYFDVNIDGQPKGRIVVQLFSDVPIGSLRFFELSEGNEGISYQLSKFDAIAPVCDAATLIKMMSCCKAATAAFNNLPHLLPVFPGALCPTHFLSISEAAPALAFPARLHKEELDSSGACRLSSEWEICRA